MNAVNPGAGRGGRPEREAWISPETVRKNELRARAAIERAREVCRKARRACEKAWAEREEARRLRAPDAALPPLEFVLPPLEAALAYLERGLPLLPESEQAPAGRRPAVTILYVWGYGLSPYSLIRVPTQGVKAFRETPEARRFAAARGWDGGRPGAWAGEQVFGMGLHAALKTAEPALRADPSVTGWGGRVLRAD